VANKAQFQEIFFPVWVPMHVKRGVARIAEMIRDRVGDVDQGDMLVRLERLATADAMKYVWRITAKEFAAELGWKRELVDYSILLWASGMSGKDILEHRKTAAREIEKTQDVLDDLRRLINKSADLRGVEQLIKVDAVAKLKDAHASFQNRLGVIRASLDSSISPSISAQSQSPKTAFIRSFSTALEHLEFPIECSVAQEITALVTDVIFDEPRGVTSAAEVRKRLRSR